MEKNFRQKNFKKCINVEEDEKPEDIGNYPRSVFNF